MKEEDIRSSLSSARVLISANGLQVGLYCFSYITFQCIITSCVCVMQAKSLLLGGEAVAAEGPSTEEPAAEYDDAEYDHPANDAYDDALQSWDHQKWVEQATDNARVVYQQGGRPGNSRKYSSDPGGGRELRAQQKRQQSHSPANRPRSWAEEAGGGGRVQEGRRSRTAREALDEEEEDQHESFQETRRRQHSSRRMQSPEAEQKGQQEWGEAEPAMTTGRRRKQGTAEEGEGRRVRASARSIQAEANEPREQQDKRGSVADGHYHRQRRRQQSAASFGGMSGEVEAGGQRQSSEGGGLAYTARSPLASRARGEVQGEALGDEAFGDEGGQGRGRLSRVMPLGQDQDMDEGARAVDRRRVNASRDKRQAQDVLETEYL